SRSRKSFERAFVMASLRESDAEDSLNSALLGILLRRIRFSPNGKCSKFGRREPLGVTDIPQHKFVVANGRPIKREPAPVRCFTSCRRRFFAPCGAGVMLSIAAGAELALFGVERLDRPRRADVAVVHYRRHGRAVHEPA